MWTFLKYAFFVSLGALVMLPLLKMGVDFAANKVTFLKPIAAYTDKA